MSLIFSVALTYFFGMNNSAVLTISVHICWRSRSISSIEEYSLPIKGWVMLSQAFAYLIMWEYFAPTFLKVELEVQERFHTSGQKIP